MTKASLAELEAVTVVARRGGFRAAARELGVSSSGLSHAVAGLEERMGVRLFNRTTRSVVLTAAGEQFIETIAPALAAIEDALENSGEHVSELSGVLRLNMALGAARFILQPLILEYLRRHTRMQVEIMTDPELIDVIGRGCDAGIRTEDNVPPDMIAVPIIPNMREVVVASSDYFDRNERPLVPKDLLVQECIRARMASGRMYRWQFSKGGENHALDVPGRLVLDDSGLMLEAALSGAGLAYLSHRAVLPYLETGRLQTVLDDWTPTTPALCLYYPGRRHVPRKLRAFIELVREYARKGNLTTSTSVDVDK
jgi:DNA-binding transcriptional LysR family regulator